MAMTRYRNERGAALIETAITLPILMLVCVGIFEFGRAYQTWQVLTNASREGARVACIEGTSDADIRGRVNDYLQVGGLPRQPDGNIAIDHTVSISTSATGSSVTINYPFNFMVLNPVVRLVASSSTVGSAITMQAQSVMRNE
jgi:Flp pilus assembly protein TadG